VIRAFTGAGMSFSRIHDLHARRMTGFLWARLNDHPLPQLDVSASDVLTSHLDPYDVEDLVYIWLQVARDYIALPRARQRDTPAYEWSMIHRDTRRRGIVQVKTGQVAVDLDELVAATTDDATDTFAYATCGEYTGTASVTEVIANQDLLRLAHDWPDMLPARTRLWFEVAA
jgi:hypothetical protein